MGRREWALVIPVKPLGSAKSRLRGALPWVPHERLGLALALDTVAAALDTMAGPVTTTGPDTMAGPDAVASRVQGEVCVVCDDPVVGRQATALGARVVPDEPRAGLNAAIRFGVAQAARECRWVAALAADLPALRRADLAGALRAAAEQPSRSYVADATGTGTVLLSAPAGADLDPRFGPGSAAAHAASGARTLRGDWPTLRRDVDTGTDLVDAATLGLGPRTAALLSPNDDQHTRVGGMQGTVASYDAQTRSGMLLLDDGTQVAFPSTALDTSGLRMLRPGQRLRIEYDESGLVARVTLPTFS